MTTPQPGRVYLVGAGPGDPELLTLKAVRLMMAADVVLHDDLVPAAVLEHAQEQALIMNVGKRCGHKNVTQEQINAKLVEFARRGLSVVRLKSGDPLVFGRAGEEMDALTTAGIEFEIVPGITAAFAAAAALKTSLTDRRAASSVTFTSGHHAPGSSELPASTNGATRVIYMPGRDLHAIAGQLRGEGLPADLPCVVISHAAQPDQQIQRTTLAELGQVVPGPAPNILLAGEALRAVSDAALAGTALPAAENDAAQTEVFL
ncbi:uroporphyrinogen-III C-methyltransferase [Paracidobacterium acidisoli]|uniref:uroporphyrinogen-III C-methyltransferase n=1 Tax=Paracidobacterium acidisoli TaxID=2303751 RepID=A0A372IN43_9BACT|nr:uroporphyrinogen-III C-methyltransferase [Paracidobacterium acidisoli]MBT9331805.1 uroporphyrinogen-III C-methyltransferase [Paracidobacterium acidisoli]